MSTTFPQILILVLKKTKKYFNVIFDVKEDHIGSAVGEILWDRHTDSVTFI